MLIDTKHNSELVTVKRVVDGDTFVTTKDIRIRLARLDAPELNPPQPGGFEAKEYLDKLIGGKEVRIEWSNKDQYGRLIAEVWVNEVNVNDDLLTNKSDIIKFYSFGGKIVPKYSSDQLLIYSPTNASEIFTQVPYRKLDDLAIEELDPAVKIKATKPGAFKIGVTWLTVPPLSIDFSEQNNLFAIPTLRTSGSPYMKDGRSGFSIDISIVFPNLETINNELRHILAQLKRCPFIPIENYYLHTLVYPELHSDVQAPETPYEPVELVPEDISYPEKLKDATQSWRLSNRTLDKLIKAGDQKGLDAYITKAKSGKLETESDANFENRIQKLSKLKDWIRSYRNIKLTDTGLTYKDQQLVLAIRRISVYTIPGFVEALQLDINCDIFNYFPYTSTFSFVEDLENTDVPVFNISKSKVFKRYYKGLLYKNGAREFPNSYPAILRMHAIPSDSRWIDKIKLQYLTSSSRNTIMNSLEQMELSLKTMRAIQGDAGKFMTPGAAFFDNAVKFLTSPLFSGWQRLPAMAENISDNMLQMLGEIKRGALSIISIYEYSVDAFKKYYLLRDEEDQIWVRAMDMRGHPVFMKLEEYLGRGFSPEIGILIETLIAKGKEINLLDYGTDTIELGTSESESVITSINVSSSPKIVPIQVLSYVTPTYQHFGNSEFVISMNLQTTSPDTLRKLRIMNQKMNAMQVAQQKTYSDEKYFVENCAKVLNGDIFKFLGIQHVMPGNFRFSTVEGKPGLYNISIDFVQSDLFIRKYETLSTHAYFDNRLLLQIINHAIQNKVIYRPYYLKILDARNHMDFQKMRQWKRGLEPLIPGSSKWSKFIYYLTKPIPTNVFPVFGKTPPPTYELLTGQFDKKLIAETFEKVYTAMPTSIFTGIVGGIFSGFGPPGSINPAGNFVSNQVQASFVKLEVETASIMVDIFKSSTVLYLKALLNEALKWESVPKELQFDNELLTKIEKSTQNLNVISTCYPDLELPDLYTRGEYTPPDFYFFQDQIYKSNIYQSAVDASLKTADIINQLAKMNLVNGLGEATQSTMAFAKTLKKLDILEQTKIAQELETLSTEKSSQELYNTGYQMLDQAKQNVELEKDIIKAKLSNIQEDLAAGNKDSDSIKQSKSFGSEAEIWQDQKMHLESQLDYYDTTTTLFDFISPPKNSTQMEARKKLLNSWGIATPFGASTTEQILKDAISIENDKTLRMSRAFPTFKLYFIEKDKMEWVMFDDFYSFAAVKSIQISKNRKSPVHTAVVIVSNITNVLTDVSAVMSETAGLNQTAQEQDVDRIMLRVGCEIMIKMGFSNDPSKLSVVFQGAIAGIQPGQELTFIAQGWGAELTNPILDKHFGALSTVKHFGDLATAILNMSTGCRHFGSTYNLVEMIDDISNVSFSGDVRKTWLARFKNWAVGLYGIQPLIDHRDDNIWLVYNTAPTVWKEVIGGKGLGFDWIIKDKTTWDALQEILYYNPNFIMKILPYNEEDLQNSRVTLYIGPRDGYYQSTDDADVPDDILKNAAQQYQEKRTLWYHKIRQVESNTVSELQSLLETMGLDTSKENTPGYTLFKIFMVQNSGLYSLHLQSTPPILFDSNGKLAQIDENSVGYSRSGVAADLYFKRLSDPNQAMGISLYDIYDWLNRDEYDRIYGKTAGILEPFRHGFAAFNYNEEVNPRCLAGMKGYKRACKYHFVDSYHHIVKNNIQASMEGMYNRILLEYPSREPKLLVNETKQKKIAMFEMTADDDIKPEQLKTLRTYFENIDVNKLDLLIQNVKEITKTFASMFSSKVDPAKIDIPPYVIVANTMLAESLKDMYSGELVVLLDPTIDVHDTIYIYDDINQIFGLIGVKEVYHYLSLENGAYTVIVPDLVTYCSDLRKIAESGYVSLALHAAIKASLVVAGPMMLAGGVLLAAGGTVLGGAGIIGGGYLFNKLSGSIGIGAINKFLGREGANIIPLWYKNMPFTAGLDGMRKDDLLVHYGDQISTFRDAIRELGAIPADIMKKEFTQ